MNIVRNKADFFDIKLITNFDPALLRVKADSSQLQQVFLNMIMNAADAMEGKGTLTLTTRNISENGRDFVEVEFRDTGPAFLKTISKNFSNPSSRQSRSGKAQDWGLR